MTGKMTGKHLSVCAILAFAAIFAAVMVPIVQTMFVQSNGTLVIDTQNADVKASSYGDNEAARQASARASNYVLGDVHPCRTPSLAVSEDACDSAAQKLLPPGKTQGRAMQTAVWDHVPIGCSMETGTGGDYTAHYNLGTQGVNDGGFTSVCLQACSDNPSLAGVAASDIKANGYAANAHGVSSWCTAVMGNPVDCTSKTTQWLDGCQMTCGECGQYVLGGSPTCTPSRAVSEHACLTASQEVLPTGKTQGRDMQKDVPIGSWPHVPIGCSMETGTGGDYTAHYNRGTQGSNDGGFTSVRQCVKAEYVLGGPTCTPSGAISELACAEASKKVLPTGKTQGRDMQTGNWPHVPIGCSMETGGDYTAHYNLGTGVNDGGFTSVCLSAIYQLRLLPASDRTNNYVLVASPTCTPELAVSQDACANASMQVLPAGKTQGRVMQIDDPIGSWAHVPIGCSMETGGDYSAHYNRGTQGVNDGGFTSVCLQASPSHHTTHNTPQTGVSVALHEVFEGTSGVEAP